LIVGPESAVSALVAIGLLPIAARDPVRYANLAALLALMVGAMFFVARAVRLGWVADYFSQAVLVGYVHGVVVVLIVGQLGKVLGLDIHARTPIPQLVEVVRHLGDVSLPTLAVGATCLAALLSFRRFLPRLPGALVVVVGSIAVSAAAGLAAHGVATVGKIPAGLPAIALPSFRLRDIVLLAPVTLGIFLVSYSDEILTARTFAGRHRQHVRADQELMAMGVASLTAGFTQGFPVGASTSRTAVNDQMGGRTQFAGLFGAAAVAIVLLFLTAPIQYLPKATLGAVIISAALALVNRRAWKVLAATDHVEVTIAAVTMAGVILVGVLEALLIAVALSIVDVVRRSASPHDAVLGWVERLGRYADVKVHPSAVVVPGVLIYRLDDRLFFANATYVAARIREAIDGSPTPVRWLIFDAEALTHVDATGLEMLRSLLDDLETAGIVFLVARAKHPLTERLRATDVWERIGPDRFLPTVRAAVAAAAVLEREVEPPV
jgi:high affinity sulfate transporter 1